LPDGRTADHYDQQESVSPAKRADEVEMTDTTKSLTLEAIGKLAGVSRSTVSRVLNDHPDVRPEVRMRVEAVIEKTGYLPNQAARALVSSRTNLIGLVMPAGIDELFGDPYYSALVHGIQEGCSETGSIFSIFPFYGPRGEAVLLPTLLSQGFLDGVIATAGPRSDQLIATLRDRGQNVVAVGHPADLRDLRRVDVESRSGSAAATAHLCGLGRRQVGFVGATSEYLFGVERLDGYRDAIVAAGREPDDRLVRLDEPNVEGGYRATLAILSEHPDALYVATDPMAEGALWALRENGLRVPQDVAVVGFDGLPNGRTTNPLLTTVVQPVVEVGRTAVHLLRGDHEGPDVVILPTELRIGDSCGARDTTFQAS
jgi:LacI family transcriptional regulator